MTVSVDLIRTKQIVRLLAAAFSRAEGLLAETDDLVERQIPPGVAALSREHALFLFYTLPNDHGMKSNRLYARAKELFRARPDLFEPFALLNRFASWEDFQLVELTGRFLGTRFPKQTAKNWLVNSRELVNSFHGDPRRLFSSATDARELLKRITAFRGFGPKIGGMLLRAIVGLGFADVRNLDKVLVPVDIHDSRIAFFTRMVVDGENSGKQSTDYYSYASTVRRLLRDACAESGTPWLDVDRALWLIGSRGCTTKRCHLCPVVDWCSVGAPTVEPVRARKRRAAAGENRGAAARRDLFSGALFGSPAD